MCDRIRNDDERNILLDGKKDKCIEINKELEKCLNENDRDFRKCKKYVDELKGCMEERLKRQLVPNDGNSTKLD